MDVRLVLCLLWALLATASGGVVQRGVFQSCTNSRFSLEGDLDFEFAEGVYVRVHSEICRETNCNTGEMKERSRLSLKPNGRQCPSCYVLGSHRCLQNDVLHCQGAANQCVDVVGTASENDVEIPFAGRGCATKDVAKIKAGMGLVSGLYIYQIKSIQLSPAPRVENVDGF